MSKNLIVFFILFTTLSANAQVTLNLKLFIEGYYSGNGLMNNFGAGGCLYVTGNSTNPNDADTITVSLAEPHFLNIVEAQKGILQTNGTLTVHFSQSPGNSYFIRVQHRSALETWSAIPVAMQSTASYDFTDSASKAFGNNMVNVGTQFQPVWAFYSGDIARVNNTGLGLGNQDGIIEALDYLDMENALPLGLTGYKYQDLTGNGIADTVDYIIMDGNVSAIRIVSIPNTINVEEIEYVPLGSYAIKFACINGTIFIDKKLLENEVYEIFNLTGQFIIRIEKEELNNDYLNLQDGIYFIRKE